MANLTTTTQIDPGTSPFYDRVLLLRAIPFLAHLKFADVKNLPKGESDSIKWRRYSALTVATAPLTEGVTPEGQALSKTDIEARVAQYGDYIHLTDIVNLVNQDPVVTETTELQGEQMGLTFDNLVRDYFAANASITTCSNGSGTATYLNAMDIFAVVQTLLGNNAKMISKVLTAGTGQGTSPVARAFWGIVDSDLLNDLGDCSGFLETHQYPAQRTVVEGEWGMCEHVRFLETSEGYYDGSTYHHIPIIGQHAYGTVNLEGGNARNIVKALGSGGTSDPLDQRMTIGWKSLFAVRILNDNFMHQLRCVNY